MSPDEILLPLAQACAAVRPAGQDDAVGGVRPAAVAVPASTQEAAGLLRAASALGLAVVVRGSGTRLHWGNPPERCDLIIDTSGLTEIVEHAAGDLVATVQAGVRLDELAAVLGRAGQRLALDPPGGGTIGGVLAAGAAGPLRLRYGTPRDLLIGITIVRADGTVARSGGKVVKNVAGYDLGKLFAGSRGTLGLITQATFRLHPVPAETAYVTAECAAAVDACQAVAAALGSPATPSAAEIDWPSAGEPVRVCVALEGSRAGVAERAIALAGLLGPDAAPSVRPEPPAWWGGGPGAQPDGTVLQVAFWPGDLGVVLAEIRAAALAAGVDPAVGGPAAAGVLYIALPPQLEPGAVAALVAVLRGAVGHGLPADSGHRLSQDRQPVIHAKPGARREPRRLGRRRPAAGQADRTEVAPTPPEGSAGPAGPAEQVRSAEGPPARANVTVLHAPLAVATLIDLFGPVPSLGLMRAVKRQFDPERVLAPGRFAGGI
ncbi:MAG TPA: FAD-binding oxidoreductase [Streptosporangiaceae bacterium]